MIEQMTKDTRYTKFDAWVFHHLLEEHRSAFWSIIELIIDQEAIDLHIGDRKKKFLHENANQHNNASEELLELAVNFAQHTRFADIITAGGIMNRQATVTFIERMLQDFLKCLFYKYPLRMYEFIPTSAADIRHGKIDLMELIQAESKDDLIYSLAQKASAMAMQGRFKTTIKNT